ncbi:hypothetical protein GCM10009613_54460 [Pseudonocardia kongjuensis]|uniref:HTH gntR-type domain-containing protein n=1 Tax=Pseudonocardia kongjuensis TaxID=102227 RepID=A0ABN1Y6C0_9PSEU
MTPRGTSRKISDEIRRQIRGGDLQPGQHLPSELQLAEKYGVSRGTIRSALSILSAEGVVQVVPGVGRKVAGENPDAEPIAAYARIARELEGRLLAGEFSAGSVLPSEAQLRAQYGVSRNTIRRAYNVLRESHLIRVDHGVGAVVLDRPEGR